MALQAGTEIKDNLIVHVFIYREALKAWKNVKQKKKTKEFNFTTMPAGFVKAEVRDFSLFFISQRSPSLK